MRSPVAAVGEAKGCGGFGGGGISDICPLFLSKHYKDIIQFKNMMESITIEDVYQELKAIERTMVTREDLDALVDTVEILSNPKTMAALRKSDLDIKEGRVKEISSVEELLSEL